MGNRCVPRHPGLWPSLLLIRYDPDLGSTEHEWLTVGRRPPAPEQWTLTSMAVPCSTPSSKDVPASLAPSTSNSPPTLANSNSTTPSASNGGSDPATLRVSPQRYTARRPPRLSPWWQYCLG